MSAAPLTQISVGVVVEAPVKIRFPGGPVRLERGQVDPRDGELRPRSPEANGLAGNPGIELERVLGPGAARVSDLNDVALFGLPQ